MIAKVDTMQHPRILVVHRRSTYTDLVSNHQLPSFSRLVNASDPIVDNILLAHANHVASMEKVKQSLLERELKFVWRHRIDDVNPDEFDLVITVGGDGTVLHASHSIANTPVLGVNSSPTTSVGFFSGAMVDTFDEVLDKVLNDELSPLRLCRMVVRVNDRVVTTRALNDVLFCHDCPASTTRYVLTHDGISENQLSSGVWVSTAAGSTAAINAAGGRVMPARSRRLQFVVREPFPAGGALDPQPPTLVHGFVTDENKLSIRSKSVAARLYVDGPHVVFPIEMGDEVSFYRSSTPLLLLGLKP